MAGIGFKLRRIFEKDSYIDNVRGLLYSTALAGGPIFFSILCLILLAIFSTFLRQGEMSIFLVTIVYIFAFSLISTGVSQLLITRYLSDLIYVEKIERILPTFTTALGMTVIVQILIGLPFVLSWNIAFVYKVTAFVLFIIIGCVWQLMTFLSAVKNYKVVLYAFVIGLGLGFILALVLGRKFGLTGFLHGYAIGQLVLFFILLSRIFIEFGSTSRPNFDMFRYFKVMPGLVIAGFCYNLGIWIDKIIFWFSPEGSQIHSFLYAFTDYDGATFVAYLTVIPSYTYFFVKVETEFFSRIRFYFQAILNKASLKQIHETKENITATVKESLIGLIKIQGVVTLICLFFSNELATLFGLPPLGALILEKALVAVFLQMLLLTLMIFMMYFDIKSQLVVVAAVFAVSNIVLTFLSLNLGYFFYGYGYLFACLLAVIASYILLNRHVQDLEYRTFSGQPLIN